MKKTVVILMTLFMILSVVPVCHANGSINKLARGAVNIVTGWVELPKQIFNTSVDENVFSGLTVGTAKGIARTVMRTLGGMYEFVTFPFPIPEDYASVIEPEFVFSEE